MKDNVSKTEIVKQYYSKVLIDKKDLKTTACCCGEELLPPEVRDIEKKLGDEIMAKYYGCGSPIPPDIQGRVVLDLGCGTGKDVFIASRLVGPEGYVFGVDMTEELLDVGQRHIDSQMQAFGYAKPNVEFKRGYIEDLSSVGIEDNSVDVLISNCVINLSTDKRSVFSEIFRVLRPGGELYFSDVFAGRRMPDHIREDPLLYSECIGGAMYIEDFRRLLRDLHYPDYRVLARKRIRLGNEEIERKVGMVDLYSMTIRAFKLSGLEDICEDYGQVARYDGSILGYPHAFDLDASHRFITGKPMLVCGNTALMLSESRYARHFEVKGDRSTHYGPFDCEPASSKQEAGGANGRACC